MKKEVFEATATLIGVTIGAGILGIPFVVSKSGLLVGAVHILVIGVLVLFVNLFMAEVVLRTKGDHQLTGYAAKYLGGTGKWVMAAAMVLGNYCALLAYTIGEGRALSAIFGGNSFWYSICFFAVASFVIFKGLKVVEKTELVSVAVMLFIVCVIIVVNFVNIDLSNLSVGESNFFLPYGVVLFAFLGLSAIPEMREELVKNYSGMKKAVIFGTLIPLFVYLFFGLTVVLVSGAGTTEIASVGLGVVIGAKMVILSNLFAIFTMATSFIVLGLALKEMYNYDFKLSNMTSFLLAVGIPLIIFLLGFNDFIAVISVAGSFSGGIDGILVVLMLWAARKKCDRKPEFNVSGIKFLGLIIIVMFLLGMVYEIANILGFF